MAKQSSLSLNVPNPCQQAWNEMTPNNDGHFCSHCNKTVIDFTQLTDEQVAAVFKNTGGKICGRFTASQLDRDLNAPRPTHHHPFISAAVMTAALVTAAVNSEGQVDKPVIRYAQTPAPAPAGATQPVAKKDTVPTSNIIHTVSGKVIDSTGAPIPWATVMIKNTRFGTAPDANGQFSLSIPENLAGTANIMVFSCVGYISQEMPLTGTREQFANLKVVMHEYPMLTGDVVVVGGPVRKRNLWQRVKYFFRR